MNTILIIALIALIITVIINVKKIRTLNQENFEVKSDLSMDKQKVYTLTRDIEFKDSTIRKQKTEMNNLRNIVTSENKNLTTKIVLVTTPNGNEVVTNAKIKTIIDENGETIMCPTIRRKVKGNWKEVPVYMKTIIGK